MTYHWASQVRATAGQTFWGKFCHPSLFMRDILRIPNINLHVLLRKPENLLGNSAPH